MHQQLLILLIILISGFNISAQNVSIPEEVYTAPVEWKRYKVSENGVSVLFPKLPTLFENKSACEEINRKEYAVYAEDAVYGLNITFQTTEKRPDFCSRLKDLRTFDEKRFDERVKELMAQLNVEETAKFNQNNREWLKIGDEFKTYWLINDFKNKRWFEIWTTNQNEADVNLKNFIASVKIGNKIAGIEIAQGSNRTLGDEDKNALNNQNLESGENAADRRFRIVVKPRADYTEKAREKQAVGTVSLKVTFLHNGGIGEVTNIDSKNFEMTIYGLTEQAMIAARKIVFIPARRNNKNITTVATVQYNFYIY